MSTKDLASLSSAEFKQFLDSFDNVLCDCDGVLWLLHNPISGAKESLSKLKKCGKSIKYVSNNSMFGVKIYQEKFNTLQLEATLEDVVIPTIAIIDHLKSISFDKDILLIATAAMKSDFREAGFNLIDAPDNYLTGPDGLKDLMRDSSNIGAVIVDVDLNLNFATIYKAGLCVIRPDVLFIAGATDKKLPIGSDTFLIGPGYFQNILSEFTNRTPLAFGKPGAELYKYINKKLNITDPSRTIFVGDSLEQDMGFASVCGYQKLLVLTGTTSLDDLSNCDNKRVIPDYYLTTFGDLGRLIKDKLDI